jgi:hypothetical protein
MKMKKKLGVILIMMQQSKNAKSMFEITATRPSVTIGSWLCAWFGGRFAGRKF